MGALFFHGPAILVFLVVIVLILLVIGYYMRTKNQERMKLIDKGIDPDKGLNITDYRKQTYLKNGILMLALGLGLFVGHIFVKIFDKLDNFLPYLIALLVFGGLGFLINYSIIKNWNDR